MRLWHKDLIPVLPRQQLLGQWRECCLITKSIAEKGTPNHILVNRIMDYPMDHFYSFCYNVKVEMIQRKYQIKSQIKDPWYYVRCNDLFKNWHNDIYLRQCLYNLEEKYICGGISNEEWQRICAKFPEYELCS